MNLHTLFPNPFRTPKWRLERVVYLVGHRPDSRPGRHDDHYVRIYWQVLRALAAAGDDRAKREVVFRDYPHVCRAHGLHYSPDLERRQILEARLLTQETIEEIATRFDAAPQVIEYYEQLFFHVRDRLQCSDWIRKVILGPCSIYRRDKKGLTPDEQRGYAYRLFAYFGGPLVLDAAISGLVSATLPQCPDDVHGWFERTQRQIVQIRAAAAAATLHLNQRNMTEMIKLGLRMSGPKTGKRATAPVRDFEEFAAEVLETVGWGPATRAMPERVETQQI
jgi:hypothetical protein